MMLRTCGVPRHRVHEEAELQAERFGIMGLLERETQSLSFGEKRLILLAAATVGNPRVVAFDEPAAGLHPAARNKLMRMLVSLRAAGTTILLATHTPFDFKEVADRVISLNAGQLGFCGPASRWMEMASTNQAREERATRRDLDLPTNTHDVHTSLRAEHIRFRHRRNRQFQLSIDLLELRTREVLGIYGSNGGGKSTLLEVLAGLRRHGGVIRVEGRVVADLAPASRVACVALAMQSPSHQLFCDSVFDEIALGPRARGFTAPEVEQQVADIGDRLAVPSECWARDPRTLSFGWRRLICLATTLVHRAHVTLLDEPDAGLDAFQRTRLIDTIHEDLRERAASYVVATHDKRFLADLNARILYLENGTVTTARQ